MIFTCELIYMQLDTRNESGGGGAGGWGPRDGMCMGGEKRGDGEVVFSRWQEAKEIGKNCTMLCDIFQLKSAKKWEPTKNGTPPPPPNTHTRNRKVVHSISPVP